MTPGDASGTGKQRIEWLPHPRARSPPTLAVIGVRLAAVDQTDGPRLDLAHGRGLSVPFGQLVRVCSADSGCLFAEVYSVR